MVEQITYIAVVLGAVVIIFFIFISIFLRKLKKGLEDIVFDIEELYRTTHSKDEVKITERPETSGIDMEKNYSKPELERAFHNRSREIQQEVEKLKQVEKLLKKWQ